MILNRIEILDESSGITTSISCDDKVGFDVEAVLTFLASYVNREPFKMTPFWHAVGSNYEWSNMPGGTLVHGIPGKPFTQGPEDKHSG